jgi:hypothetical protein
MTQSQYKDSRPQAPRNPESTQEVTVAYSESPTQPDWVASTGA